MLFFYLIWTDTLLLEKIMNKNNKKGFTLVEILIVVLVIGLLAAIALPQYRKSVVKSRLSTMKNLIRKASDGAELFYMSNHSYPAKWEDFHISLPTPLEENSNTYTFKGFYCQFFTTGGERIICTHHSTGIGYQRRFIHTKNNNAGKAICVSYNSIADNVCKVETGKEKPFYTATDGSNQKSWLY